MNVTYRLFMDGADWTDSDNGSIRTALNDIVVEVVKVDENRYQPIANGRRQSTFAKPCQCDNLEDAKCYAWLCFGRLLNSGRFDADQRRCG
jgi:hypothetical protein